MFSLFFSGKNGQNFKEVLYELEIMQFSTDTYLKNYLLKKPTKVSRRLNLTLPKKILRDIHITLILLIRVGGGPKI